MVTLCYARWQALDFRCPLRESQNPKQLSSPGSTSLSTSMAKAKVIFSDHSKKNMSTLDLKEAAHLLPPQRSPARRVPPTHVS